MSLFRTGEASRPAPWYCGGALSSSMTPERTQPTSEARTSPGSAALGAVRSHLVWPQGTRGVRGSGGPCRAAAGSVSHVACGRRGM